MANAAPENGLTVNWPKCKISMSRLQFSGHVFSDKGLEASDDKKKAVAEAREPESASEVCSFMGLVTYCAKFMKTLATVSEPLGRLYRKGEKWRWGKEEQDAFAKVKKLLVSLKVMSYYIDGETRLIVDASPVGLAAILTQKQQDGSYRPVSYVSKSLTDVRLRLRLRNYLFAQNLSCCTLHI